jgi:hypothetical protein
MYTPVRHVEKGKCEKTIQSATVRIAENIPQLTQDSGDKEKTSYCDEIPSNPRKSGKVRRPR